MTVLAYLNGHVVPMNVKLLGCVEPHKSKTCFLAFSPDIELVTTSTKEEPLVC